MATEMPLAPTAGQLSYGDLYARWERGNWRSTELDFSEDKRQWRETFSEFERKAAIWNYALFFWGEDAVADNLSPYIDAAPLEEQKYFLATQQVDEARHAVFFARFMREVAGIGGPMSAALEAMEPELTWGYRKVFKRLDRMADELRRDRSRPQLAAAIALYHLVIEASMAQPGQHFIESYLEERGVLPGFYAGMQNVAQDEQRHIGFGVKILADLVAEDPDCRYAVADLLREVLPWTVAVLVPPNWDLRYTECFGFTLDEIGVYGTRSLESKLRAAGLPLESLPGPPIMPEGMTPEERSRSGLKLLRAGILGEKLGPPDRDPDTVATLFDVVSRSVDRDQPLGRPITLQWEFSDAEPWHLTLANGNTSASAGRHHDPDLRLRCRFEDWVDIVAARKSPVKALATGRLRPRGDLRVLARLPQIFGR